VSTATQAEVPTADEQEAKDAAQLASLGYRQQLTRAVGLWQNFTVGFTYLSPIAGVYPLFAYGLATAGPAFFWTMPIVVVGQLVVLLTFSEIASQYPIAGGIFQWTKRLVGPRYAWLSGWLYTWALLVTVASIAFSSSGYASQLFGYTNTHLATVICAAAVILICSAVNLAGIRRLAFVSSIGTVAELIATVGLGIYLLIAVSHRGIGAIFHSYGAGSGGYTGAFLAAALFSVWIFYGFEACGDIAEEVKNPSQKIPRAMRMTLGVGSVASAIITIAFILAVPSITAVISGKDADPIGTILTNAFGSGGSKVVLAVIVFAFISACMSVQAAATRLVFSYARDGMIVGSRPLSNVHPRFHMPPGAVAVTAVIPIVITLLPTATVARIITFAVVGIYVGFQSVVLASLIARRRGWRPAGAFTLGKWGPAVNLVALVYGVSAIVVLCIKTPAVGSGFFDRWLVPISLVIVAGIGLLYLLIARPRESIREDARVESSSTESPLVRAGEVQQG
jgi:amino acid transporter